MRDLVSKITGDADASSTLALGRMGACNFIATAVVALLTLPLLASEFRPIVIWAAVATFLTGLVFLSVPWDRWPREALVGQSVWALVVFTLAARTAPTALPHYLPVYTATLLFVGITQRARFVLEMALLIVMSFLLATGGQWDASVYLDFGMAFGMGLTAALVMSAVIEHLRISGEHIDRVLRITRELGRSTDIDDAVNRLGSVVRSMTGADSVLVLLAVGEDGERFRGFDSDGVEITIEMGREMPFTRRRLRHREPDFIADLDDRLLAPASLARALQAKSALVVPMHGETGTVGAIIIGWQIAQRSVDRLIARTMMLVAGEVGLAVERHREADRVQKQARTDPLTGLLNRRAFDEYLLTLEPGDAVMLIDLDHFKAINDRNGHAAGDRVLRTLAACIHSHVRATDAGARIGGDELAILVRGTGAGDARRLAESLRTAWNAAAPEATISIGVATHEEGRDVALTVARADRALYRAKESGRDCTVGDDASPTRSRPTRADGPPRRPRSPSGID